MRIQRVAIIVGLGIAMLGAIVVSLMWYVRAGGGEHSNLERRTVQAVRATPLPPKDPIGRQLEENREAVFSGVRGIVTLDGNPVEGATVYGYVLDDRPEYANRSATESRTVAGGKYELPVPRRPVAVLMDLGVVGQGFRRVLREAVVVEPDETTTVDFEVTTGEWITGRIVDEEGTPVSGVALFATSKPAIAIVGHMFLSTALLDTRTLQRASRDSRYYESEAFSDSNGEFVLEGLAPGEYAIVTKSYEWLVNPPAKVTAPHRDVLVTARRAERISARVVDDETGEPIPRFTITISLVGRPLTLSGGGLAGRIVVAWLPKPGVREASVRVQARGHLAVHKKVQLSPPVTDLGTLRLRREGDATLNLDVRYDDGSACTVNLIVEYGESEGGQRGQVLLKCKDPGVYVAKIPAGQWYIRLTPAGPLGITTRWRGEVTCSRENSVWASAVLPRCGQLTVVRPAEPMGTWELLVMNSKAAVMTELTNPTTKLRNLAAGEWTLRLHLDGALRDERVVTVVPGGALEAEFR